MKELRIKHREITLTLIYIIIALGFAGASVRITDSGWTEIFRWASLLTCFVIIPRKFHRYKRPLLFFGALLIYNTAVSALIYGKIQIDIYPFYIFLFLLYVLVKYLRCEDKDFNNSFFSFLDVTTVSIILFGFAQYYFGFNLPHIQDRMDKVIYLFFWNENELSVAISCMSLIYFYRFLKGNKKEVIKVVGILIIDYINDAKISLIGVLLGCGLLIASVIVDVVGKNILQRAILYLVMLVLITILFMLFSIGSLNLSFNGYDTSVYDLVEREVIAIFTMEPLPGFGSLAERTNAIIYGMRELLKSHFFGIGFGNATDMMSRYYGTIFLTANTMHNLFFQFMTECGFFSVYSIYKVLSICKKNIREKAFETGRIQLIFIVIFVLISSQSSQGILSNYMVWTVLFYIMLLEPRKQVYIDKVENVGCMIINSEKE